MKSLLHFLIMISLAISLLFFTGCPHEGSIGTTGESIQQILNRINEEHLAQDLDEIINEFILDLIDECFPKDILDSFSEEGQQNFFDVMAGEFLRYTAIRDLSLIPTIDEPVVLVNGEPITKREIATWRILFQWPESTNEVVTEMIRLRVALQEAVRMGLKPDQHMIDGHVGAIQDALHDHTEFSGFLIRWQIEWMGITEDEFIAREEKYVYESELIVQLQRHVVYEETGMIRSDDFAMDIFMRHVDNLVERANIEILDPELKKLFA